MKRKMRKSALAMIAIALLLSFGLVAAAGTTAYVGPGGFASITAALVAANLPGSTIDVIDVALNYGGGNTYPILVQKDGLTIRGHGTLIPGAAGSATFVVGAAKDFDPGNTTHYTTRRVTGVTVEGFYIHGGEIGILIKEADEITIRNNMIGDPALGSPYEGIRLLDATGCTIDTNTITNTTGIGIFLENSDANTLSGNTVTGAALGLFVFESNGNTVTGDTYNGNDNGGVVLNDSIENMLSGLLVQSNTGWGVRFVFADYNYLLFSMIGDEDATDGINKGNTVGGVELLGSQGNLVEGNIVYNNGTSNDGSDDAQIVITFGDKAIFTNTTFTEYNVLGDLSEFVTMKFDIYGDLDIFWDDVLELDVDLWELRQNIASAIGMCVEEQSPSSTIVTYINNVIIAQKGAISGDVDDLQTAVAAIRVKIWNNTGTDTDSLKEKLVYLLGKGLITTQDEEDLREKLDAALGFLAQIDEFAGDHLGLAIDALELQTPSYVTAKDELLLAKGNIEAAIEIKLGIYLLIEDIRYKLCLVDLELPPFPRVNSILVGKKEKPFFEITTVTDTGEIDVMTNAITTALAADTDAAAILTAVTGDWTIFVDDKTLRASTDNTIASNLVMSDLLGDTQIGIVIECPDNILVNNSITNEKVLPIDSELGYGEFHRLDIAILLLSDENLLAYNAIEWVNVGIIRGGTWKRDDVQVEYVFESLAAAAYWPEPGFSRTGCPNPNIPGDVQTTYLANHFTLRVVDWVPVLSVKSVALTDDPATVDVDERPGFDTSQRVKRNRLALNFFEYVGTSIDIVDAESNTIDENLFYNCSNGILFRAPNATAAPATGGAGPNIVLEKNDYYSGVAINNQSGLAVDANRDYTPPQGTVGHATVFGLVNPPAVPAPNAYDNFGTNVKYVILGIMKYYPGDDAEITLPPNLEFFYAGVTLPVEKPRHPSVIFDTPQPVCLSEDFPAGWNLVSIPVVALDSDPEAVFGDDVPFLYMFEWDGTGYVVPTEILPEHGYWIYLMTETTLDVCGTLVTVDDEVQLGDAGWHIISTPTICVRWQDIEFKFLGETKNLADAVAAGWLRAFFYGYDGDYEPPLGSDPSDLICPWPGYWIKTLEDGLTMVLPIEYTLNNPPVPPLSLRLQSIGVAGDTPPPPPAPPGAANPDDLVIVNTPNPIRDVHTTVFKVMGGFVEAVRVRIYDLSGQLVFEDENPGNELAWHTENLAGEYLANGAYLYRVEVKVGDQWIITKVQKLVIYR
jgi:parallel beta-helix repeat protein